ncbi:uncharacterized protein K460DRAFT_357213 [Cucurbitaria berberidis CBS 394.84]|uniref:Ubiquitin 3 binding protein But2 C-terminal domain-containing protein n=1 Tax=Cucurbitaria berberidis CBS 394.84 TaxID=1168544 RepID=A0A9P4GE13_9PLEO|nr:uncharacterized protein K460DRAFT_357213 [Cucurbitaria berberidis CBS 394.84]KAF1843490.1 hypothetical protein K460DRAFT_357213 [Cucurbitaria berberidis CBS 394.84]
MARFLTLLGLILVATTAVFAAPILEDSTLSPQAEQLYYIRVNARKTPWHGHWLTTLPTSQQLGIENFTIHPSTPPLRLRPIRMTNHTYALRSGPIGNDLSRIPYLAALNSKAGTRTVSMAIVHLPSPKRSSFKTNPDACPEGFECTADQWVMDKAGKDGVYSNIRFAGFKGKWQPFNDAAPEGWSVYWKGNAGLYHPVRFDLVPFARREEVEDETDCED